VIAAVIAVNISSLLHDAAGRNLPAWKPVVWELTSGFVIVLIAIIPLMALRHASPDARPLWRTAGVHLAASLLFSVVHVMGIIGLRKLAYALIGERYVFGLSPSEFLYEYRKDLVVYGLIAAIFWVSDRLTQGAAVRAPSRELPARDLIDIRDGTRLIRARAAEILCARAAGNYVEFSLVDGQKPLMRSTLAECEEKLKAVGFVRSHRSWLVNQAHVRESEPTGSGDFILRMSDGSEVPLSRRFADAVALVRGRRPASEKVE
jgi:hypothetical protein